MGPASPSASPRRRGFSSRHLISLIVLALALPALGWSLWPSRSRAGLDVEPMVVAVEKGEFIHDLTEQGTLESANNVEVRCEVKSNAYQGTTILEIVPEGKMVEQDEVLVRLDSATLESDRTKQQIAVYMSLADVIKAQTTLDTATLARKEFLEGTLHQQRETIEGEIFVAEEMLRRAQEYATFSARLARKGYVTALQLEADRFAVEKSRKDADTARTKLRVLDQFTKQKTVTQLDADIKSAEAKLQAQQNSHKLECDKLALIDDQLRKCVIRAPCAGQVVYANVITAWGDKPVVIEAGATARERQVLIRLPDRDQMQVKSRINEAKIALVSQGQATTIHLDALPDLELFGTVEKVEEYPIPTNRFTTSAKEYETTIRIHHSPPGLRPGLTAEVKIHVERIAEALFVPVQAVIEHGDKHYCILRNGEGLEARQVTLGSTNDKTVVIQEGAGEGEQIVRNPAAFRDKVNLPELPRQEKSVALARAQLRDTLDRKRRGDLRKVPAEAMVGNAIALVDRVFAQFDKNGEGRVRLTDLPEELRPLVASADSNADGILDRKEIIAARMLRTRPEGGLKPAVTHP